jgi:hypothetical protein
MKTENEKRFQNISSQKILELYNIGLIGFRKIRYKKVRKTCLSKFTS